MIINNQFFFYLKEMNFFILFGFLLSNIKLSIISFDIDQYDFYIPYTHLYFPTYDHYYSIYFNTYLPFNVFYFNIIQYTDKTKHGDNETIYLDSSYPCFKYTIDDIKFENLHAKNLGVYISNNYLLQRDFGLSLGYHFKDDSYSLVHNLYKSRAINKLQFAFNNPIKGLQGKLYIGGVPQNSHLKLKYKGIIKVNEELPTWGFYLDSITFNKKNYIINLPAIIHSSIKYMFVSNEVYNAMINNVFKTELHGNNCQFNTTTFLGNNFKQNYISCQNKFDSMNDEIQFKFGKNILSLKLQDLFEYNEKENVIDSSFLSNGEPNKFYNFDGIILGMKFLSLFNYTLFDYDNHQIEFYSDRFPIINNANIIKQLLLIIILLTLFSLIVLLYSMVLFTMKNKRNKRNYLKINS